MPKRAARFLFLLYPLILFFLEPQSFAQNSDHTAFLPLKTDVDKQALISELEHFIPQLMDSADAPVFEDRALNNLGYQFMRMKKMDEAIAVFKLNVQDYPDSWNVYDSLGEAYMENGQKELAIKCYKKSLELNPDNTNGRRMLEKLVKK
ncbi:MAG: tetratricopeptide repeat protein [bacterium]